MIIATTPLRVSFFGGGSDLPQYYNRRSGMVISTTINKKIQIAVNRCQTNHIRAVYSEMEVVNDVDQIRHNRIREALKFFAIKNNIEICSFSDVPTKGTGLGSSSTFTVGLVHALYEYNSIRYNKKDLAGVACEIEIDKCCEPIGKQDQYAAAYGGFNVIRFNSSGTEVTPLNIGASTLLELNDNLMCYSTGISRNTSDILTDQVANITNNVCAFESTNDLVGIAEIALGFLEKNRLDDFGALIGESWTTKKKLSKKISNPDIDTMYEIGTHAGALGGKLLGAGGGGYMLFYVPRAAQNAVGFAMRDYKRFYFSFTDQGSTAVVL